MYDITVNMQLAVVFCMHCWACGSVRLWLSSVVLCESVAVEAVMVRSSFGSEYQLICN